MSKYIVGADECGYGSAIGDIVVCSVRAPKEWSIEGLNDSKKLTAKRRAELLLKLEEEAGNGIISYKIATSSCQDIDSFGLGHCHKACYVKAINLNSCTGDEVIIDGNLNIDKLRQMGVMSDIDAMSVVKADSKFPTVMAASIIAKQYRDAYVIHNLDPIHPEYDWKNNIGYLSKKHLEAISKLGLTPFHRKSYKIKISSGV